jgi:hypothetical protein
MRMQRWHAHHLLAMFCIPVQFRLEIYVRRKFAHNTEQSTVESIIKERSNDGGCCDVWVTGVSCVGWNSTETSHDQEVYSPQQPQPTRTATPKRSRNYLRERGKKHRKKYNVLVSRGLTARWQPDGIPCNALYLKKLWYCCHDDVEL